MAPLSKNSITGDGSLPVNLADGDFDEEQAHKSFLEALLEWRGTGSSTTNAESKVSDGLWSNPVLSPSTKEGEEEGQGGTLWGNIDEEAEHEAFAKAVMQWRNGGRTNQESKTQSVSSSSSSSESKLSCWNCYKLFYPNGKSPVKAKNKVFCSSACENQDVVNVKKSRSHPLSPSASNPPSVDNVPQGESKHEYSYSYSGYTQSESKLSDASISHTEVMNNENIERLIKDINEDFIESMEGALSRYLLSLPFLFHGIYLFQTIF